MTPCTHKTLKFGSGGRYIFCADPGCNAAWISWKIGANERIPGVDKGEAACGTTTMGIRQIGRICAECSGGGEIGLADGELSCPVCGGSGNPNEPGPFPLACSPESKFAAKPECSCGLDKNPKLPRTSIVCPKHDGKFSTKVISAGYIVPRPVNDGIFRCAAHRRTSCVDCKFNC